MREAAVNLAAMNTPDAIPTGGPFINRPTRGDVPYEQPIIKFLDSYDDAQELRYHQWLSALPEREKDRRWRERGNS